ncbi:MAG: DNA repair protein RecO [Lachnospiraceae bacterium]|nr:DNA repair protein RecO [Lachnospiraceae bacterium]
MNDVTVSGMVLQAMQIGEYDLRVVILTRERGKISAFAKGARRQGNPLGAYCRPFAFGEFTLYEGRTAYTVRNARIKNYFEELQADLLGVYYGFYFLEFASFYTRENNDEFVVLKLLYYALLALQKESLDHDLVQAVYELKLMMMNGDYPGKPPKGVREATAYTMDFVLQTPVEKLFTFTLKPEIHQEFIGCVEELKEHYLHHEFSSMTVLEDMKCLIHDTIS